MDTICVLYVLFQFISDIIDIVPSYCFIGNFCIYVHVTPAGAYRVILRTEIYASFYLWYAGTGLQSISFGTSPGDSSCFYHHKNAYKAHFWFACVYLEHSDALPVLSVPQSMLKIFDDPKIQFSNKLRLVLLYMLRYRTKISCPSHILTTFSE